MGHLLENPNFIKVLHLLYHKLCVSQTLWHNSYLGSLERHSSWAKYHPLGARTISKESCHMSRQSVHVHRPPVAQTHCSQLHHVSDANLLLHMEINYAIEVSNSDIWTYGMAGGAIQQTYFQAAIH